MSERKAWRDVVTIAEEVMDLPLTPETELEKLLAVIVLALDDELSMLGGGTDNGF